jgi:glycosyltransferase involved in cell wall biosynthesis
MMPFKLNNLIESVDPVKFYEYINFNKDIISIYYKEIDRYSKYVYFYLDFETFKNAMSEMINNPSNKYSDEDRKEFLKVNTWERRAQQIKNIIDKNLKT